MDLNNREIAFLVWAAVFIGYISSKKATREPFGGLIRGFLNLKIVGSLVLMAVWIGLCVYALASIEWWRLENLKSTLIWSVTFAFVTMLGVNRITGESAFFRKTAAGIASATVAVTFIAELYSFSLFVELLLLPFLAFVTALHVMSEREPKHAAAHKLSSAVLIISGMSYFSHGTYGAITNVDDFLTWANVREFFVPILLSFLFFPFIYAMSVFVSYEKNMTRLGFFLKDDGLRRYAAREAMMRFRLDLEGLRRWTRNVAILRPSTPEEIRSSIAEVLLQKQRERNPPEVSPERGWSPYAAKMFLAQHDLTTSGYHRIDGGLWIASSTMVELDKDALISNNLAYYIEGDEYAAKRLMIKLNVNSRSCAAESESRFLAVCEALLQQGVGEVPTGFREKIYMDDAINYIVSRRRVQTKKEDFANRALSGYSRLLIIDHSPDYRASSESSLL